MQGLKRSLKKLYQDYKDKVVDIILFGSFAKNKFRPGDVDIAIILRNTKEPELLTLMDKMSSYFDKNIHLNLVIIDTLMENPLYKTLLNEGISLLDDKPIYQKVGYESGAIFSINLTKLNKSRKVLFSYALHGKKNNEGILKRINGKMIGKAVMFIPTEEYEEFKQFLELWGVDFYIMRVLRG